MSSSKNKQAATAAEDVRLAKSRRETAVARMHAPAGAVKIKSFLDMIAPSIVKFNADHFICGNTYRSAWALREYPTATQEQAILRHLGEKDGITLRIYTRQVTPAEEKNNHGINVRIDAAMPPIKTR